MRHWLDFPIISVHAPIQMNLILPRQKADAFTPFHPVSMSMSCRRKTISTTPIVSGDYLQRLSVSPTAGSLTIILR